MALGTIGAMHLGAHAGFILAAYAGAAVVIAGLVAWTVLDHRAQRRILADLERRGITRRAARSSAPSAPP
jgi:heme exporter protein D